MSSRQAVLEIDIGNLSVLVDVCLEHLPVLIVVDVDPAVCETLLRPSPGRFNVVTQRIRVDLDVEPHYLEHFSAVSVIPPLSWDLPISLHRFLLGIKRAAKLFGRPLVGLC